MRGSSTDSPPPRVKLVGMVAGDHLHQAERAAVAVGDGIEARLDRHDGDDEQRVEPDAPALAVGGADELARGILGDPVAPGDRAGDRLDIGFGPRIRAATLTAGPGSAGRCRRGRRGLAPPRARCAPPKRERRPARQSDEQCRDDPLRVVHRARRSPRAVLAADQRQSCSPSEPPLALNPGLPGRQGAQRLASPAPAPANPGLPGLGNGPPRFRCPAPTGRSGWDGPLIGTESRFGRGSERHERAMLQRTMNILGADGAGVKAKRGLYAYRRLNRLLIHNGPIRAVLLCVAE